MPKLIHVYKTEFVKHRFEFSECWIGWDIPSDE